MASDSPWKAWRHNNLRPRSPVEVYVNHNILRSSRRSTLVMVFIDMFKKGDPRPEGAGRKPGRPAGALNRGRQSARDLMEKLHCDPLAALIKIARKKSTPLDLKIDCLKAAAKYCYPALTAAKIEASVETTITDLRQQIAVIASNPELQAAAERLALALAASTQEDPETIDVELIPD
jgi:hypothetical protein